MSSQTGLGEEEEEYFDAADIEDQDDVPETVEVQRKLTVYRRKYRLNPGPAVSLVLVGKVRNGKSSTGNTICGKKDLFPSSSGLRSKTKSCQLEHAIVAGREIVLVDTPGNLDTRNPAQALSEIGNAIYLQPNGYDAILLVLKWDTGITNLEKMAIEELKKLFGEHVLLQYAVLVFTHGDTYDSELPFTEFIKSQGDAYLQQLLHECQNRCVLINNKQDEASSFKDVQKLFDVVDSAREKNNGEKYTNEFFEAAKEQNEKFEQAAKEKRRELERATRAVEVMRQKNELDTLQTRKNLKDKHEEDMKLKVTEHQKRQRDKLHRQLDNEKQKYSRMIKSEMDRAEEIISFNFKQNNSFDNAYLENELKKTLEEYKATTYTGWERMIESELYHFKSNLDILYKDSDLKDHYSDTLEDNMKKFKLKVDDIQNKLRLQCSDKTTAALNVQINFLTLMKDKKWELICKRMKSSACDTEKQTLENIRLEFEEIQRYTTGKIASFVEYKENKAESERLFWMETEIEIDIRMRKRRESLREELTQIRQEFEKSWRENTLKRILMKSRGEMLQSFEKISSEINEQFQKEIQTERRSNEMLVRGAMLKEVKVRELKDIKQYLVEESETQSRILSENLSRHVEAEQDLDLQLQELQNTVDRDIVTVKAKVEDLQKCQHDTWVKDVESQMTTACSKLEKLCKTRLEELQNLWTKLNDDKGKLWMGVFERKIDELMSDYKAKILQEFDDNIKANATKKARLQNEWDMVEKTWEIERKHTLKHEEVDWKCYVQKEFTLEGVIGRNIFECQVAMSESNLEKQITANRLRQEEEWRNICSQKMEIFLKKLDIRAKETTSVQRLAFTREQEDLRAKRLKKLKTRSQEFQLTKEKAWSDSLEDKRGIFIVKVIEELKAETDCSAVLQKRWKDHITRERKDFEVEFRKGLRCIKEEKERKW